MEALIAGVILCTAAGWMFLHFVEQNGRLMTRIEGLERDLKWRRIPGETAQARRQRLFQLFSVGNRFEADNILRDIVYCDEYQVGDLEFDPADVVIDVGAHIGVFSYLCYVQGSRAVYSYEPGSGNFALLTRNLGTLPGVHLFNQAVWRSDLEAPAALVLSPADNDNTGSHTVMARQVVDFPSQSFRGTSAATPTSTSAVSLDEILARFSRIRLLKLDCEGSEFPILLTSRQLRKIEHLVAEVHEIGEQSMNLLDPQARLPGYSAYRIEELVATLERHGFAVETRAANPHMYWLSARRGAAPA